MSVCVGEILKHHTDVHDEVLLALTVVIVIV